MLSIREAARSVRSAPLVPARLLIKHQLPGRLRVVVQQLDESEPALLQRLSDTLSVLPFVEQVQANAITGSLTIVYDKSQDGLQAKIVTCLEKSFASLRSATAPHAMPNTIDATNRSAARSLQVATLALPVSLLPFAAATPIFWACIAYSAWPSMRRAVEVLIRERRLNVDFQDSVSICLSLLGRQHLAGATMTWLIALGDAIRERTALRSKRVIHGMLSFQNNQCWVVRGRRKIRLDVREILVGDSVVVYPGELIPVDGIVLKGKAMVDQKTITGESQPVDKAAGQEVFAGTILQDGQLYVKTTRCGPLTVVAQIVQAVETMPLGETRAQNYAEKVADKLVAPNVVLSGTLYALSGNVERFLSMMIVDFGTGIRVAAPTAIVASMTDAARQGILIKSGGIIEKLARVDTVVFDKTGTITRGEPTVTEIICYWPSKFPRRRLIALAASAEARLKHPAAHAVTALAKAEGVGLLGRRAYRFHVGLGVQARVGEVQLHIGSAAFLQGAGVDLAPAESDLQRCDDAGQGRLLLAAHGKLIGMMVLADEVRPEMAAVIRQLRHRGIRHITMLTGDNVRVASHVARGIGLTEFIADVMPAEKAQVVRKLMATGRVVAMVGDGVNDSVALAHADVGIAMRHGADIARDAADVVLMQDYMGKLIGAIDISRDAMKLIKQNVGIVTTLNAAAMGLSIPSGLVSPALTALISNGSAILASLNSIRPIMKY